LGLTFKSLINQRCGHTTRKGPQDGTTSPTSLRLVCKC
jgi:hypothetical protein